MLALDDARWFPLSRRLSLNSERNSIKRWLPTFVCELVIYIGTGVAT